MRQPDALELDAIGREVAAEFSVKATCCACDKTHDANFFRRTVGTVSPWRLNAERLIDVLDRLGFRIVRMEDE